MRKDAVLYLILRKGPEMTLTRKMVTLVLCMVLACGLLPVPALALESDAGEAGSNSQILQLEPGTYVEHEAIAYVADDATDGTPENSIMPFSQGGDILADAQSLMEVSADAAEEALGNEGTADANGSASVNAANDIAPANRQLAEGEGDLAGRFVLVRDESKTTEQLIADLEADARVVFAEPNALVQDVDADDDTSAEDSAEPVSEGATLAESENVPESTSSEAFAPTVFGEDDDGPAANLNRFVWGFDNDGRMAGVSEDQAVDMRSATWSEYAGESSAPDNLDEVVVAVVDTGVDAANPDLAPVMWSMSELPKDKQEKLAATGKEDEHGFSAQAGEVAGNSFSGLTEFHGTHVAGTIAAAWNGEGVSGIAPNARIMAVRYGEDLADVLSSFDYLCRAVDAGVNVRVSNNSWGFGQTAWRALDVALTEMGHKGIVSVFASGNSDTDNDTALATTTVLADNPYVVVVNAIDPTGDRTTFSQYGLTTTDVMAPGSAILSTWNHDAPIYLGEEDRDAVFYESFDNETRVAEGVKDASGNPLEFGKATLSFTSLDADTGEEGAVGTAVADEKRFDGDCSYAFEYRPVAGVPAAEQKALQAYSSALDLSDVAEKPRYLSLRYTVDKVASDAAGMVIMGVFVPVRDEETGKASFQYLDTSKTVEDGGALQAGSRFGIGGDSWHGMSIKLPDNTAWDQFRVILSMQVVEFTMVGGVQKAGEPVAGTVVVDSIGLGSDCVPYAYEQGTSMASPAVAGAAAAIAGTGAAQVADDKAKSAEKLAALVKGAAQPDGRYAQLCSTGGFATVDGAASPGPALTAVHDEDETVTLEGYFLDKGAQVKLGGAAGKVAGVRDLGDGKVALSVEKPAGFAGGQVTVEVDEGGKRTVERAVLTEAEGSGGSAAIADEFSFDQKNLPLFNDFEQWGAWQLVGFDGKVYALPRADNESSPAYAGTSDAWPFVQRFDPVTSRWEQVALPTDVLREAGISDAKAVLDVSGATCNGALVLAVNTQDTLALVSLGSDGQWSSLGDLPGAKDAAICLSTLASDGENLYLFGGFEMPNSSNAIVKVDLEAGSFTLAGMMSTARTRPQVAYHDGTFLVGGGCLASVGAQGFETIEAADLEAGAAGVGSGTLDDYSALPVGSAIDYSALVTETGALSWAPAAVAGGFALAGPESDEPLVGDGAMKADTYLLSKNTDGEGDGSGAGADGEGSGTGGATTGADGEAASAEGAAGGVSFELSAYGKRASEQALLAPAALGYRGHLYVLAATQNSPYRVFSATTMQTDPQPGDTAESESGSELGPQQSSDGGLDGEPSGSEEDKDAKGSELAKTGDVLGMVALVLVAIAAVTAVIALVLRRRR